MSQSPSKPSSPGAPDRVDLRRMQGDIVLEILNNDHHDNLRLCQQINDDDYDKNYDLCTMTMVLHENRDADDTSILIVMTNHFR